MTETSHRAGFVSIAGRPNAGKSTLLNQLVGEKLAIIAHQPQTTRTSIQAVLTTPEAQIVFIDTPGIHKSDTLFNKRMMDTVRGALQDRDLILFVTDSSKPFEEEDEHAISALDRSCKALLVPNKIDRVKDKRLLLPLIQTYTAAFPFVEALPVSARNGDGIDQLKRAITEHLPDGPAFYPANYSTDQPMRFLAAEIIREQILRMTRDEVPHATAILVDSWEEKPQLTKISATIYVERSGQKIILIGNKGEMLKKIGSKARVELERMLEHKVFLSLFVKVKSDWREDPAFLNAVDWRSMIGSEQND
ncbi:MAG: GTPase Era [Acidobacteriaceae bacterium]|nr:GTPase Era [Acidobacteriaceae bacterium]MBV9766997.1 GTPase Era [Acidobacteriaceae bacterium]